MLIIEGTDLTGKTTIAREIIQRGTPWGRPKYRNLGLLPGNWNYLKDYINLMDPMTVWDRFWLSELAYGPVIRGGTPLKDSYIPELVGWGNLAGAYTLVITAEPSIIKKRFERRGDPLCKLDQILAVNAKFMELMTLTTFSIGPRTQIHLSECDDMPDHLDYLVDRARNEWLAGLAPVMNPSW